VNGSTDLVPQTFQLLAFIMEWIVWASPGWSPTLDPFASASRVLGLQACTTTLG
jgi:hypothetical protein